MKNTQKYIKIISVIIISTLCMSSVAYAALSQLQQGDKLTISYITGLTQMVNNIADISSKNATVISHLDAKLVKCPKRLTFTHDGTPGTDEYLSYHKCEPIGNGEILVTLPFLIDTNGYQKRWISYMKNDIPLARLVCNEWGMEYVGNTSTNKTVNRHVVFGNPPYVPFGIAWSQDGGMSNVLGQLTCRVGNARNNY